MAIVRLTDIVATMKDKWTYGDKFFGYTEEFNDNHNTQYPSLLITPPDSVYPEVTPRNGWEEYSFEVYFSDLYNRTAQKNESIEQRWDNLQDLANEWLDMFLKSYMRGTTGNGTTIAYLMDGSLAVERKKEVANDQLLQLKMNFGYRIFSKCFAPVSNYPNQISGLTSWLRADSNVTFNIPTKKVSIVGDGSGNANGVAQLDKELQPLRYTYGGGALDKTMLTFNNDVLVSDNNFTTSLSGEQFSVFEVSKINAVSNAVFGYFNLLSAELVTNGDFSNGLTDWTENGGSYATIVSGALNSNNPDAGNWYAENISQNVAFVNGTTYKLTFKAKNISGNLNLRITQNSNVIATLNLTSSYVDYTYLYTANADNGSIRIFCNGAVGQFEIDDISVADVNNSSIEMGTNAAGNYEVSVSDGTTTLLEKTATVDTGKFHIASLRKQEKTIYFNYYDSANTFYAPEYDVAFDGAKSFEQSKFTVGCVKASNGLIPPAETNTRYLDGDFQELIIYDRKLTDAETAKVVDYLNKKYRIY